MSETETITWHSTSERPTFHDGQTVWCIKHYWQSKQDNHLEGVPVKPWKAVARIMGTCVWVHEPGESAGMFCGNPPENIYATEQEANAAYFVAMCVWLRKEQQKLDVMWQEINEFAEATNCISMPKGPTNE